MNFYKIILKSRERAKFIMIEGDPRDAVVEALAKREVVSVTIMQVNQAAYIRATRRD